MRNPSHRLLSAATLLLLVPIGCQTPLKSTETADLKPPQSLLGKSFDADAARAKAQARRQTSDEATIASSSENADRTDSVVAQAGFRNGQSQASSASQLTRPANPAPQPQTPEAITQHIRQGSEAMSRQDWANATTHYETILSADPQNPLAHQMLGRINDQTQRFESAEYHYLRALSERPQDPNLLSDLGYSYLQQGSLPNAKRFLLKALAIDANHQMAKANLAAVEAYSGNVDAALALLKQISSEQEAHRTLHELLSRPAPAQQRDQQMLSQGTDHLPLAEQMRIARDTARGERSRHEALESLEMRERVRQAMAIGGPLNKMGQGIADEEIGDIIAKLQEQDRPVSDPRQQTQYAPQQHATGPLPNALPQFGQPQQPYSPSQQSLYGAPSQNQYPQTGSNSNPGSPNDWSMQTLPYYPEGAGTSPQQQNPQYSPQNYGPPNASPQSTPQNWQQPGQSQPQWDSQSQWNGPPQLYDSLQDGHPANSGQQMQQWQAPPAQNPTGSGRPPALHNLQQQNEMLFQQQFGSNSPGPANSNQYQNFPNGQQQYAPPSQFPSPPMGSQPAAGYDSPGQYGNSQFNSNGYGSQYAPPPTSGVWNPQGSRSAYESQTGAIQQLGHQTTADRVGPASRTSAGQNSMRQAMRLGMAAGPGSLIQMDGRSPNSTQQQPASDTNAAQQFFPENTRPQPGDPSSAVWNPEQVGRRTTSSPNQNLWQSGPMPTTAPNLAPPANDAMQQWQSLPSAQQQPQSSTWNHQSQQPVGATRSQNWSAAESAGSNWQSHSVAPSPTLNESFAPGFMLRPDPTQADSAPTIMAGFNFQGSPSTTIAAPANPAGQRIPFTVR